MALKIRGLTIEIGGDTSQLQKSLKEVNSALKSTQSQLKDVNSLLKLDPTNTELLYQKQKSLKAAIEETKEKITLEKNALAELKTQDQTPEVVKQQEALEREIIANEQKLKSLKEEFKSFGSVAKQQFIAVGQKIKEVGTAISDFGTKLTGIGRSMSMYVTTPIVTGFGAAVKSGAEFDKQMSAVKAVAGATQEEYTALRTAAMEWGEKSVFTAKESADALYYMALAGWDAEQSIAGLGGVLDLAAAGASDLGDTSDIVTDYLTAFKMEAEESGHFANVMAAAMSNTNTTTEMLGETFKYAAPVAGALGYSLEDTAIAAGVMANSGIKASQAGTTLRTIMNNMASPTAKMAQAMNVLGVSLTDDEDKMYTFREVLDQLRISFGSGNIDLEDFQMRLASLNRQLDDDASSIFKGTYTQAVEELEEALESGAITTEEFEHTLKDYDNQLAVGELNIGTYEDALDELMVSMYGAEGAQMAQYASMLAGKRGMSGLLAIVTEAPDKYQAVVDAIDNADKSYVKFEDEIYTLQEAYEKFGDAIYNDNSFEFMGAASGMAYEQLNNLSGSWTLFTSKLGTTKVMISDLIKNELRGLVDKGTELLDKFNNLDESEQMQIVKIAGIVAAIGPALIILGTVAKAVGSIISLGGTLIQGIGTFSSFIVTTLIPGIGSAATFITGTAIPAVISFATAFAPFLIGGAVIAGLVAAGVFIYKHWDEIKEKAGELKEKISEAWEGIKTDVKEGWEKVKKDTAEKWEGIKKTVSDKVAENGGGIGGVIKTAAYYYATPWRKGFEAVDKVTGNKLSDALQTVKDKVSENGGGIGGVLKTAVDGFKLTWDAGFTKIDELTDGKLSDALQTVKDKVSENGGGIGGVLKTALDGYKKSWELTFDGIDSLTGGKLGSIRDSFQTKLDEAKEIVRSAIEKIKGFFDFKWELPKLKMPHFSIEGKFSLNPPSIPHISVDWYKKAYDNPVMFKSPTVLSTGSGLKGFGDGNGGEIVVGANNLMGMIQDASGSAELAQRVNDLLGVVSEYLPTIAQGGNVYLDKNALVGRITPDINRRLGLAYS